MKTVRTIISVLLLATMTTGLQAQKYEKDLGKANQLLIVALSPDLHIKGVEGNTLSIKADQLGEPPAKAEGLKPIYGTSTEDNTGIGLNVSVDGNVIKVTGASKESEDARYEFLVPKRMNVKVLYDHWMSNDVYVEGMAGELDIKTLNGEVELKEVTGPVVVHAISGDVICDFVTVSQSGPTSITAINGDLDVSMPGNTPADLTIKTINGAVYSNIDIQLPKSQKDEEMVHIGGSMVEGTINGGGVSMTLNAINNNIYIRKK